MIDAKKLACEFLGTAVLVVIAVGVATENFGFKLFGSSVAAGVVTTALAFGLVLMALAYAIGPISGCHVNPAVTMGFLVAGRMKVTEAIGYMVAQVAGAIAGALVLWGIFSSVPGYSRHVQGLGTDGYGAYSLTHVGQGGAFITEVVLTFVFVMVVLFATHKAAIQGAAGLAIGMALVAVHLVGIPLTGTSVNPARKYWPCVDCRRARRKPVVAVHRGTPRRRRCRRAGAPSHRGPLGRRHGGGRRRFLIGTRRTLRTRFALHLGRPVDASRQWRVRGRTLAERRRDPTFARAFFSGPFLCGSETRCQVVFSRITLSVRLRSTYGFFTAVRTRYLR